MGVMEEMEVILFLKQIKIYGHYSILNLKNILKLNMVRMEANLEALALMVRMNLLKFQ